MQTKEKLVIGKNKNRNLEGKLAVITGAGRGLGKQMAIDLASRGANLILTYGNSQAGAQEVVDAVEAINQKASAIKFDVSKVENISKFRDELKNELKIFGAEKIDILINNAGIAGAKTASDMTSEAFDELFDINLKAVFFTIRELEGLMSENSSIINLSSSLSNHSYSFDEYMVYSSTKAAINTLTRDFAVRFGPKQIRVNAVAPGATMSDMTKDFLSDPAMAENFKQITALNRIGYPDDISSVVAFLASDDSRWITGEVLETSGGAHL